MLNLDTPNIKNGGWHLSYFGDVSFIQNKIREFAHVEYNMDEYTNEYNIKNKVDNNIDLFNRDNQQKIMIKQSINDDKYPPIYYKTFLSKFVLY
jgi:beta-1,4-mannosyl-glycoprotein beta-1,4-N-acetylglucosaminyltransferase